MALDFAAAAKGRQNEVTPYKPFDIDAVKIAFEPYRLALVEMRKQAEAHQVTDEESLTQATTMAGDAKRLAKSVDQSRKAAIEDHQAFVKRVNAFAKSFTEPLGGIESSLKGKIGQYQYKKELERREAERKAQEEAKALQKKLDAEAKEMGVESVKVQAPTIPTAPKVSRGEDGSSASIRKTWTFEIQDPAQVPREFCSPDPKLLREAVKAGLRKIAGVKIYEEITTVLRT